MERERERAREIEPERERDTGRERGREATRPVPPGLFSCLSHIIVGSSIL